MQYYSAMSSMVPLPPGDGDQQRRAHSALRRRLLQGNWYQDLEARVRAFFPPTSVARFGALDLSRNVFRSVTRALSQLYSYPPSVSHADMSDDQAEAFAQEITAAGLWPLLAQNQVLTVGLRESLVRVDYLTQGDDGRVQIRLVPADLVYCEASADSPDEPNLVIEARVRMVKRQDGKSAKVWTWDVLDLRDPEEPRYRVVLPSDDLNVDDPAADLTEQVLGGDFSGDAYPYRVDGRPVIPYVLYHRQRGNQLWDPYAGRELVDGTLQVGALYSLWGYLVRDASHPLRYLSGAKIRGTEQRGQGSAARQEVHVDPTAILQLLPDGGVPVQAGQWQAGTDPERLQMAIDSYEIRSAAHGGLQPDDMQRVGGPESGVAIALKREAVREHQRLMVPEFERGDRATLSRMAALLNRYKGTTYPETGWRMRYPGLPLSPQERAIRLEEARAEIALGVASLVDVVRAKNPGWSREEAAAHLELVQRERRMYPAETYERLAAKRLDSEIARM
jgi:hypothetical protein